MNAYRYETFTRLTLRGRRYFFRFVAPNNEIMAQSQPYKAAQTRNESLQIIRRKSVDARIVEVEK